MPSTLRAIAVCLSLASLLAGQALPEFEVASLKANTSGMTGYSIVPAPGGKLDAKNISLKRLIAVAYSVTDFQIFGDLPWLESARWDLTAKAAGPAPLPQLRLMLRSLLTDRFQLKYHKETRELKIYSMTQAKPGAPFSSGLVEDPRGECAAESTQQSPNCGLMNMGAGMVRGERGRMSQLADRLSALLGVTVVDKTGLAGYYNVTMKWSPDPESERMLNGQPPPPGDPAGPSVFTAMQEQLGLKLTAGRGPVEVIVIDSAQKAAEN